MSNDPVPVTPARPARVGQATAIEQSRAMAEVQAAVVMAHEAPRDIQAAIRAMQDACRQKALAERAFYRFSRGGGTVSGASVYLARELALCWTNVQHSVAELARDDEHGQSEMQAVAWDLETNVRSAAIFIVPHKRDKRGGPEALVDMRDIYENNANAGARRVRECIFSVLPLWFRQQAEDLCRQTLEDGGGKPLQQRISEMLTAFRVLTVTEADIERKLGRPASAWTAEDLADLAVIGRSIKAGEISRDAEFPPPLVSADELTAPAAPAEPTPKGRRRVNGSPPADDGDPNTPTAEDIAAMNAEAAAAAAEAADR